MLIRSRLGFNFFDVSVFLFCIIYGFICFYPLWYVLLGSLSPIERLSQPGFMILPPLNFSFKNYAAVFNSGYIINSLFISFAKTFFGSVGAILITSTMAYGVSKTHITGMKLVNVLMVFTMFFSGGLIPYYLLIRQLGMYDTFWVLTIPTFTNVGNFILMRNYFSYSVPKELEDACAIDGGNEIKLFFRIVFPIAIPMVAALFLFEAVGQWNDWFSYLIFCRNPGLQPLVWILQRMLSDPYLALVKSGQPGGLASNLPPASIKMTTIIIAMLPIMVVYPFLQKHFAKGVTLGAVKE